MPTLADIYSAINTAKRKGTDFIQNPGSSLAQMAGFANDRARAQLESDKAATDEFLATRNLSGPAQMQNAMQFAQGYNPVGMTVYHGSPHIFERFDLKKLGTGEGNQSYGRGMYVAQNPEVAQEYKNKLTVGEHYVNGEALDPYNPRHYLAKVLNDVSGNTKEAVEFLQSMALPGGSKAVQKTALEAMDLLKKGEKPAFEYVKPEGAFYKVDLPDTHIRRMLDWDEPLKNQPAQVRKLAKSLGMDMNDLGGDLIGKIGKGEEGKQILEKAGIRGIKYFDQMSRGEQTGTRNFVVFDPNHMTILERNNKPIK
jgi:hypothetical protein